MARAKGVKWSVDVADRAGEAAHKLATDHRQEIETRLSAGLLAGLRDDLDSLRGRRAGAKSAHSDQYASTRTQNDAATHGAELVSRLRRAVREASDDEALHKAFGVGQKVNAKKVSSVEAALQTVLDAAAKHPDATRDVGILPSDLQYAQDDLDAVGSADVTQEGKKISSVSATANRNATQARIEKAVSRIVAAGILQFADRPLIAAQFEALIPGKRESGASDKDKEADKEKKAAEEKAKQEKTEKPKDPPQKG